jgi:hypothetical protein
VVDLPPRVRPWFAALFLGVQAALIVTAARRPDHAFGFQMFSESTVIRIRPFREVDDAFGIRLVPIDPSGTWVSKDAQGNALSFAWNDRIKRPELRIFDQWIFAGYGADAQLDRLRGALSDMASHLEGDTDTRRLVLEVDVKKNGGEAFVVRLESPYRWRRAVANGGAP